MIDNGAPHGWQLSEVAPAATAQILAPNDVTSESWQCSYPRYFTFSLVHFMLVEHTLLNTWAPAVELQSSISSFSLHLDYLVIKVSIKAGVAFPTEDCLCAGLPLGETEGVLQYLLWMVVLVIFPRDKVTFLVAHLWWWDRLLLTACTQTNLVGRWHLFNISISFKNYYFWLWWLCQYKQM